ncbi:CoA transferase [Pikeienuella sp. HZG-20]|uniref:CaiB/BaiF CoA transferase family protein n=1 Tax=Paludibacillus litoralis TaxID=3133267 RepID=UPI0030ED876C
MAEPAAPLAGIRVIDLTRVLSGPFCSMLLGDLGADVVKVESPAGDPVRAQGAFRDGHSWYFAAFNRNKRSVVLDLYTDAGKEALRRLLADADVLVENFRPGTLAKLGLDAETLNALNPRLIVASVNGYGSTGPYADRPAFDFVVQAMSGFMAVNGPEGSPPMRTALPITDLVAGLYAALAVTAALRGRDVSGKGQAVEVSLMNAIISLMAYLASEYFATGRAPVRTGNDHPLVAPYGLYAAADGEIAVAPSNDAILRRFLTVLGLEWLLDDPRFDTNEKRFGRRPALKRLIEAKLADHGGDHWIERLNAAGVPCGRVQDFDQVFSDPQVLAQNMAMDVEHPGRGPVRMLGFPMKFHATPCTVARPAPRLGSDTFEALREVGVDQGTLDRLAAQGAFGADPPEG